jgi:chemotaxis methyl-accepting protein methylase
MHKRSTSGAVLEHELSELRLILERQTGVLLDTPTETLSGLVSEFVESRHMASSSDLLERLRTSDSKCEDLAECLFDGETRFFRYPAAFETLAKVVLPELQTRHSGDHPRTIRIWSAGCSTGEEAYSIAMSVCEVLNGNGGGWNVHIVSSDIRRQALEVAERGLYPQSALKPVPRPLVRAYFARVGEHFLVKPRVRNLVTFAPLNLAQPGYIGQFDCIFCMDVLPHFSAAQRAALVQRLQLYLQPGGYLFLGQGEKLPAVEVKLNPRKNADYTVYQKPAAAAANSGR